LRSLSNRCCFFSEPFRPNPPLLYPSFSFLLNPYHGQKVNLPTPGCLSSLFRVRPPPVTFALHSHKWSKTCVVDHKKVCAVFGDSGRHPPRACRSAILCYNSFDSKLSCNSPKYPIRILIFGIPGGVSLIIGLEVPKPSRNFTNTRCSPLVLFGRTSRLSPAKLRFLGRTLFFTLPAITAYIRIRNTVRSYRAVRVSTHV